MKMSNHTSHSKATQLSSGVASRIHQEVRLSMEADHPVLQVLFFLFHCKALAALLADA